jgi:hypothetical protein
MPIEYKNQEILHRDDLRGDFSNWHHEGGGTVQHSPNEEMRLHCALSRQGAEGTMMFFRPDLPDHIAVEYDITIRSHGGLVINFLAMRGLDGEDMIKGLEAPPDDTAGPKLPPRPGTFPNYFSHKWGLQSYHVSFSRFNDKGEHTQTSNWRRNPGLRLVGHGVDPVQEIDRRYHVRLTKDRGHCQCFIDGKFAHAFVDHDTSRPIPDYGKFGFRLIGSDVMADIANFVVYRIEPDATLWKISE